VVDDPVDQPEDVRVLDLAGDQTLEDGMIDRREELADVGLEHVAEAAGERLAAVDGGMRPLALAAGVAVEDERVLEAGGGPGERGRQPPVGQPRGTSG
jgi:hypothetical protein